MILLVQYGADHCIKVLRAAQQKHNKGVISHSSGVASRAVWKQWWSVTCIYSNSHMCRFEVLILYLSIYLSCHLIYCTFYWTTFLLLVSLIIRNNKEEFCLRNTRFVKSFVSNYNLNDKTITQSINWEQLIGISTHLGNIFI